MERYWYYWDPGTSPEQKGDLLNFWAEAISFRPFSKFDTYNDRV